MKDINEVLVHLENDLKIMMENPISRRQFLSIPLAVWLTSCASSDKTRYREGDNSGQASELTIEDEKKITREYLPEMKKDYPPSNDIFMQKYITNLGNRIVLANKLNGNPYNYTFTVTDVPMVNAFALPAGTVFVTTPLIALADSEAELSGVIGHEIGHVKARHAAERQTKAKNETGKSILLGAGGALLGGVAGFGLGKLLCPKNDNKCVAKIAAGGAVAGVAGGLLIQKYYFLANSREDEMEADRIGFRTSYESKYHKDHVGKFYSKLLEMEKKHKGAEASGFARSLQDAMSTHPPSQERVKQMNEMAGSAPLKQGSIISTNDFAEASKRAKIWTQAHVKS